MDVDAPVEGREGIGDGRDAEDTNLPLISVIVPIYNVEKYVRKCLESLKNQTMKQIEVICIDDGSTDSSGRIADEYCNTDEDGSGNVWPIFRVIHHDYNRGLSAARNTGIDSAEVDWIMFVDSDDWVEPDFCRIPYEAAVENQADMVVFQADTAKKGKVFKSRPWNGPVGIVDEMTAHEYGAIAAWNKLYKKNLFGSIRYPEGRVAEDTATTHKIVHHAKRILIIRECLYHHIHRYGSISFTRTKENKRDGLIASIERVNDLISYGYPAEKLRNVLCGPAIGYLGSTKKRDIMYDKAVEIVESTDEIPESLSKKQKIAMRMWKTDRRLFYLMSRIAGRLDG